MQVVLTKVDTVFRVATCKKQLQEFTTESDGKSSSHLVALNVTAEFNNIIIRAFIHCDVVVVVRSILKKGHKLTQFVKWKERYVV